LPFPAELAEAAVALEPGGKAEALRAADLHDGLA
jgi:hypothetical protein